jgi:hypothetical protein
MPAVTRLWRYLIQPATCLLLMLGLAACSGFEVPAFKKLGADSKKADQEKPKDAQNLSKEDSDLVAQKAKIDAEIDALSVGTPTVAASSNPELLFLLSMNFDEAKAISAKSIEMPMGVKIAADSIEILKEDGDNKPKKVRAKGRVYLENGVGDDLAKILCQEAYISSWEIVLRGKPIIQRGGSTIEGLEDRTVAYMLGSRLRVIGKHRLANQNSMLAMLPDLGPWTGGPNPILPPLTEDSVPNDIREQMLKAAEAEAVLQQTRVEALTQPAEPAAPWVKGDLKAKTESPAVPVKKDDKKPETKKTDNKTKETPPPALEEKPKAASKKDSKKA